MPYIGNDIQYGELTSETFTGDGSTVAFTMGYTVANTTSILVTSGNVVQEPTVAYTVAGTTLTFTSAPEDGDTIHVRYLGRTLDVSQTAIVQDTDQDTKIQVEESADEDIIRFDTAGSQVATLTGSALDVVGDITGATLNADGATSAGDNAAIGYTAALGLVLTGQGSTNDITLQRDDATAVLEVATGQSDIEVTGGNIFFGTASKGVYLGVTSATAANLLADYEEGEYTATVTTSTSGGFNLDGAADVLSYTKVGRVVTVFGELYIASDDSPNGNLYVSLPFTSTSTPTKYGDKAYTRGVTVVNHADGPTMDDLLARLNNGEAFVRLYEFIHKTGVVQQFSEADVDGAFQISVNLTYFAA